MSRLDSIWATGKEIQFSSLNESVGVPSAENLRKCHSLNIKETANDSHWLEKCTAQQPTEILNMHAQQTGVIYSLGSNVWVRNSQKCANTLPHHCNQRWCTISASSILWLLNPDNTGLRIQNPSTHKTYKERMFIYKGKRRSKKKKQTWLDLVNTLPHCLHTVEENMEKYLIVVSKINMYIWGE